MKPNAGGRGNVLLGIGGGIAAYKIPGLVSLLGQQGFRVRVILSEAGARFASREALEALSGQIVYSDMWRRYDGANISDGANYAARASSPVLHIALVEEADIFLVAPATYNWIGKAANGLADDLLSLVFAAWPLADKNGGGKPLLFAPAMNSEMWRKEVLRQNVQRLRQLGCQFIEPASGFLACRAEGQGRMAEPEELYYRVEAALRSPKYKPLAGKKILLSAGPTREALDPVRYISNRSSGKTGIALACAARDFGAEVTLISGIERERFGPNHFGMAVQHPVRDTLAQQLFGIRVLDCNSASEMAHYAADHFPHCDWALAVAAVCDFRPTQYHNKKIKKNPKQENYSLELQLNPDILAHWGAHKTERQKVLGFALESEGANPSAAPAQERDHALAKMQTKNADAIVLNRPQNLESSCAQAQLFFAEGPEVSLPLLGKYDFAAELLRQLCARWL